MGKRHIQKLMAEKEKQTAERTYGQLPVIPSKSEIINKQLNNKKKIALQQQQQQNGKQQGSMYSIQPSIKPFVKRSLQPERRRIIQKKRRRKNVEKVSNEKTIPSLMRRMAVWGGSTFNQQF